jgi:hypothetical protein
LQHVGVNYKLDVTKVRTMSKRKKTDRSDSSVVLEPFELGESPIPLARQPVGPPMPGREGLEFMAAMANLNAATLRVAGEPNARNDLSHVEGVCYALCRFTQAAGSYYEHLREAAYRDAATTLGPVLGPLKTLVEAVADRTNLRIRIDPAPEIIIFGRRLHERQPRKRLGLPFFFQGQLAEQGPVVTAVFYLGLIRESRLLQRCADKECSKIFVAMRETRVFCSATCAGRASTRAFRERQQSKLKLTAVEKNGTQTKRR